jgi:hypothetical protein
MACYSGPNPVKDEERAAIWKWAKANGIDQGMPIEKVGNAINDHFFSGHARPEWISDILSGRKTPYKQVADAAWKAQYNRRVITQQAADLSRLKAMGPVGRSLSALWTLPRSLAVTGHAAVFPITHGGDLAFRPASWGQFVSGILRTYHGAASKAFTGRMLDTMQRNSLYTTALRSGLDVGPKSHATGILSGGAHGPAARAWDMLTVMRFKLWEGQMQKFLKPEMSHEEVLDVGKHIADWANHATGSGKGPVAELGKNLLFGPKLTQSKLNRLTIDPSQTLKTYANWNAATPGEKAAARIRLSGAVQYLATGLGFLAVNYGANKALGTKDKDNVNLTDPTRSDWMAFKTAGIEGYFPGLHTELRTVGKILATAFMSNKELRGESRQNKLAEDLGQYGTAKFTPAISKSIEIGYGQNWQGRPLPWNNQKTSASKPQLSWGEYAASIGPIPLQGPIGYFYDHMKKSGASPMDAMTITKGLIISGLGATGLHVKEEPAKKGQ